MTPEIKKGILLSFPRSGNHLVRFLIEFLTSRPTKGCMGNPEDIDICKSSFEPEENPLGHVKDDWIWCKHHFVDEIDVNKRRDRVFKDNLNGMLLLFRDPVECILRHEYFGNQSYVWNSKHIDKHIEKVKASINYFLDFSHNKHLIIYENLIDRETREEEIKLLSNFIGGDDNLLEELLDDLDFYYNLSLISKMNYKTSGCISGEDPKFHSKRTKNLKGLREYVLNKLGDDLNRLKTIRS